MKGAEAGGENGAFFASSLFELLGWWTDVPSFLPPFLPRNSSLPFTASEIANLRAETALVRQLRATLSVDAEGAPKRVFEKVRLPSSFSSSHPHDQLE